MNEFDQPLLISVVIFEKRNCMTYANLWSNVKVIRDNLRDLVVKGLPIRVKPLCQHLRKLINSQASVRSESLKSLEDTHNAGSILK